MKKNVLRNLVTNTDSISSLTLHTENDVAE